MPPQTDALAALRDIHLPDASLWWPPAPGWWIGLALILLLALLLPRLRRWWRQRPLRRLALGELARIREIHKQGRSDKVVVEELARRRNAPFRKMFWLPVRQAGCRIGEHEVRLIQPTTYMNRSGKAVWGAMKRWRVEAAETVVVYDDVDLEFGGIRVRAKGTGGSHNGMKSVVDWLQTKAFPRVRVGIGPKPEDEDMIAFVLDGFTEEELLKLEKVVERAADAVESIFSIGTERTMNAFNPLRTG